MARRRNKQKTPQKSSESLAERARLALQNARFKDALSLYKQLLKTESRDEWKKALARAYLGRARELSGKGLHEEALAVLGNAIEQDPALDVSREMILCSICAGRYESAVKDFLERRNDLNKEEITRLESVFALAVASGVDGIAEHFPEESKLRSHLPLVQEAITAYCGSDEPSLAETLAKVPFNSPYRDLRSILSVLSRQASDNKDGTERLSKIADDSAFKPAARIAALAVANAPDPADYSKVSDSARAFILAVQGIGEDDRDLIKKLSSPPNSAKKLFNLLVKNPLPDRKRLTQDLCYRLLPQYPQGMNTYQNAFGPLEQFELHRINALALEKREQYDDAAKVWTFATDAIAHREANQQNRLIRAMFLRRAAFCAGRGSFIVSVREPDFLEKSLDYDPDDLPTYHRLFEFHKDFDDDAYRACVERAVKQFPEDSGVLMAAIELAVARNTFKKASRYAKTLLRIDPINPHARMLLVKTHLAHAGKLIQQKRFDLASKEIDSAEKFEPDNRPSGLVALHRGLLGYARGDEASGEAQIDRACKMFGGYLTGYFRAAAEMIRLGMQARYRKKYLALLKNEAKSPVDKTGFLNLIREIQQISREHDIQLSEILPLLKKTFSSAVSLDLSRDETEWVCDTFQSMQLYQALMDFAEKAVKRWPDSPIFDYFLVYARSRGDAANLSPPDSQRLEEAIDKAHDQKNIRVANRLIDFFESGFFMPELDENGDIPAEMRDVIERFIEENPDPVKVLQSLFGDEGEDEFDLPPKRRRRRKKSSADEPYNLDLFDDQPF